jgi:hypothetical protein
VPPADDVALIVASWVGQIEDAVGTLGNLAFSGEELGAMQGILAS